MVRHVAAHLFSVRAAAAPGREVQRLYISPAPVGPDIAQAAQIAHRGDRVDREGEKAAVWGDDHVAILPALEGEVGAAMRLIAVAQGGIERVERAFGYAPGLARKTAALLHIQAEAAALEDQACPVERQEQRGHEVFKHRPRPACKAAVAVLLQLCAAQGAPVPHRHIAFRDGDVACQHGFACHEVVPAAAPGIVHGVIADIEQAAHPVIERCEIHPGHDCAQP